MQVPDHLLGYKGDPKWRDMSDYLVHFTSESNLLSILRDGEVKPLTHGGWAMKDPATKHLQMSACFSEIPVDVIDRLTKRRGRYGIGFRRDFIRDQGGGRLWYAAEPQRTMVFNTFKEIWWTDTARTNPLWKLLPFFDSVTSGHDFTWEREWRVPGGVLFGLADVAFLIVPRGVDVDVFQNPAPGVPQLSAESMEFWTEAFAALGGAEDHFVDEFLKLFGDPIDYLNWDSEDQDYAWVVDEWDTRDAIESYLEGLDEEAAEDLASRLDKISSSWVLLEDLERIGE
jgi:hypothetical protein